MDVLKTKKLFLKYLLLSSLSVIAILPSLATASYQFDKIRIILSPKIPVDTIKLSNPGKDEIVNLQLRIVKWTQENGVDTYTPAKDLIVAPPIMKIPPGKTQITRIGWKAPRPLAQELAYRLIIQDLTPYKPEAGTVRFKIEASMPIFITPDNKILQAQWRVQKSGGGLTVTTTNTGNVHYQINKITITNPANNSIIATLNDAYYILPKTSKTIALTSVKPASGTVVVTAQTDNGKLVSTVDIT